MIIIEQNFIKTEIDPKTRKKNINQLQTQKTKSANYK